MEPTRFGVAKGFLTLSKRWDCSKQLRPLGECSQLFGPNDFRSLTYTYTLSELMDSISIIQPRKKGGTTSQYNWGVPYTSSLSLSFFLSFFVFWAFSFSLLEVEEGPELMETIMNKVVVVVGNTLIKINVCHYITRDLKFGTNRFDEKMKRWPNELIFFLSFRFGLI